MKKQRIWLFAIVVLLTGCMGNGKRGHRSDFLPPIKIEIPAAIKSDAELTNLVKESEKAINEFSDNMEYLIEDIKPYKDVKEEDIGTFDKIKLTKIAGEFMLNSANGMKVLEKFGNYSEKRLEQQQPLTDEQMKAMAIVYDTFEARMKQLEKKYQEFVGKKSK